MTASDVIPHGSLPPCIQEQECNLQHRKGVAASRHETSSTPRVQPTSEGKRAHGKKPVFSQCLDITSYICKKECDGEESLHRVGGMSTSGRND